MGDSYSGPTPHVLATRDFYDKQHTSATTFLRRWPALRGHRCSESAVRRPRWRRRPGVVRPPTRRSHWSGRGLGAHLLCDETHRTPGVGTYPVTWGSRDPEVICSGRRRRRRRCLYVCIPLSRAFLSPLRHVSPWYSSTAFHGNSKIFNNIIRYFPSGPWDNFGYYNTRM